MLDQGPLGLYIHVPFCSSICNYCNFNRVLFDGELRDRYVSAVEIEIRQDTLTSSRPGQTGVPCDTVYFGGGTPSLLRPGEVGRILTAARERFEVAPDAEITLEANPDTVSAALLEGFLAAGINRLSVGVQSFRDDELRALARRHDRASAITALRVARQAGFDNISLDLMIGLPTQSLERFAESVDAAIETRPDHVSMYMLELYPHAPLRDEMARHGWEVPPDDEAADMYELALDRFGAAGLEQYEISNLARRGRESRHNLKYWQDGQWRGYGPGAHSTIRGVRWKDIAPPAEYVALILGGARVDIAHRQLSREERWQEALMTGLRLTSGIEVSTFNRDHGLDVWATYGELLQPSLEAGLIAYSSDRLRLTRRGMLLANDVLAVFI